jgi:polar amino acid transport system substrate-binding protein
VVDRPSVAHVRRGLVVILAVLLIGSAGCSDVKRAASGSFEPAAAGKLTVATELPVRGFWDGRDPASVHAGFEWALAKALARELGLELVVREVPFADIAAGRLGGADLALAQVSATDQRRDHAELTVPYFDTEPAALARSGTEHNLQDLATAKDQRWVVQEATTLEAYLDDVVRPDEKPLRLTTTDAVVRAVVDGDADVAMLDLPTALTIAAEKGLVVPARFDHPESIVGVVPKGSDGFEAIDTALHRLIADGTVARLRKRWLDPKFSTDPDDVAVILAED